MRRCQIADATADQIASYLVRFSQDVGDPITNLKLQKLLYYAQGWYLALYDKPLFEDRIEAWPHGPVVPRIYGRYKYCGWQAISDQPADVTLSAGVKAHLDELMDVYGTLSAYHLELLTHEEAPWKIARGDLAISEPSNEIIKVEDMKRYFKTVMNERENKQAEAATR